MKLSLTLRPRRALTRSEAMGCLTANIALPGAGSLAAGRAVGYAQMALAFVGLVFSVVAVIPMAKWAMTQGAGSSASTDDPFENLAELWRHIVWPLFGVGIFALSIIWALATSLSLLASAPKNTAPPVIPPANG